eukprot:CAMPEP_0118958202 /NCGR_PEP_ID=MMETSP1169-20130426/62503_1 /TAXON_ID=36882 /ORGANISM="Pyramimonas obovata, Strain CCMP722" /LENGTH=635 /DNA_ID=CAMNT_0006906317 /DNA_START=131 /DNA_END=2035 /DNA_ORIENTATION=-
MSYSSPFAPKYSGTPGRASTSLLDGSGYRDPGHVMSPTRAGNFEMPPVPDLPVSDILYGYGEWREVPPVVRSTLKTLYDTVQTQAATMRQMQRTMMTKAEQSEVSALDHQVSAKISYAELNEFADDLSNRMLELNSSVSRKAESTEIMAELADLRSKVSEYASPAVQRWLEMQAEKQKNQILEQKSQITHHSGLVSEALEVAARHREVELEAQKVWVDDQLRKLKKGTTELQARETSERERAVLSLWKEVRSLAESLSIEQAERRGELKDAQVGQESLSARISQLDAEFVQKLSLERDTRVSADEKLNDKLDAVGKELRDLDRDARAAGEKEVKERLEGLDALRTAFAAQIEGEAETRRAAVLDTHEQLSKVESNIFDQLHILDAALETEKAERVKEGKAILEEATAAVQAEKTDRTKAVEMAGLELTATERRLTTALQAEKSERTTSTDRLLESLAAAEARMSAALGHETADRKAALHAAEEDRKKTEDTLRAEATVAAEDLRDKYRTVASDLAATENFLGEQGLREAEERKKEDAANRTELSTQIDTMRREFMQRMREVEENAIETAREMTDGELMKRESQYDVLKKHVDFCTKGTADEVIQMWQYVQRIDTDVRDVVLRLDNRMAKIYGRTW